MGFSAYAYFSHSISSGRNMIQAANFSLEITNVTGVTEGADGSGMLLVGNTYVCEAKDDNTDAYTFTLKHAGTAETGYCKIEIYQMNESGSKDESTKEIFYTTQIFKPSGENNDRPTSLTLSIQAGAGCVIEFTPQWGTSSYYSVDQKTLYGVEGRNTITYPAAGESGDEAGDANGTETGTENEAGDDVQNGDAATESNGGENSYTVVKDDTLQGIAERYNTTVDALVAYNEIENADEIILGQVLQIPPSDWVIPSESVESTETESAGETVGSSEETAGTEAVKPTEAEPTVESTEAEPTTASTEAESSTAPTEATEAESATDSTESSSEAAE